MSTRSPIEATWSGPSAAAKWSLVAALLAPVIAAAVPSTFIGLRVPPYPSDCAKIEGAVLGGGPPYRLGYERLRCAEREFVVLDRLVEFRDGLPFWEVVDDLELSVPPDQQFWGVLVCQSAHGGDEPVFAVGAATKTSGSSGTAAVTRAWRFDLRALKIQPVPARDVSCAWESDD